MRSNIYFLLPQFFFFLGQVNKGLHQKHLKMAKIVHTKYTNKRLKNQAVRRQEILPLNKQPIYKVNYRQSVILYLHPSPIHKSTQERIFDSLVGPFDIIERSSIPFLPQSTLSIKGQPSRPSPFFYPLKLRANQANSS